MSDHFINFAGNEEIELSCTGRTRAGREKEEEAHSVLEAEDLGSLVVRLYKYYLIVKEG